VVVRHSSDGRLGVEPRSYDLVWNFNSLPQAADPDALVDEMCGATTRLVLIFVGNARNYGFPIHRLHHRVAGEKWTHGDVAMMDAARIARMLEARGFRVAERLLVDTPWWPDIDSPIEEVAATFLPFLRRFVGRSRRLEHYTWTVDDLPYFDPDRREALERELGRHFLIEKAPWCPVRTLFAHHRGVLAERKEAGGT
jgi:hypothetical protein